MVSGRSAIPGDPLRGLEPAAREVGDNLLRVGVADVPLPGLDRHIERQRALAAARALARRLGHRLGRDVVTQLGADDQGDYVLLWTR